MATNGCSITTGSTKLPLQSSNSSNLDPESITPELSEDYSSLLNKGIHESTLQSMWKKVAELVTTDGMIVPIPGEKACLDRMVASRSRQVPHVVRATKKSVFKCNGQCQMYNTNFVPM